ncbi:hypothetical protein APHCRT_1623 [Anaplasma phagocytophilum str. CRT53-1]|uniref:Uncharacterized protein n=1 Tax=Anaplasma phagocytophilum str. CRT53-1 TaxID=1359157 RepID=A0A0F3PJ73_ANAPH|nr:hypothetical protein APHCRT_1623 [Anaplasma phagocytophilum str. CRT53-1]
MWQFIKENIMLDRVKSFIEIYEDAYSVGLIFYIADKFSSNVK